MSDILFRYLLMARKRDHSRFRWLFYADEQLLEAGVEQLVETACARVDVRSQHERVGQRSVTVPASHRNAVTFYDEPRPNRPAAGHFVEREEEFPLKATLRVYQCTHCRGSGEVRCGRCHGRGSVACGTCGGKGRRLDGGRRHRCPSCGGRGDRTCPSCHGSGWTTCDTCRGERELASWDAETYKWLIEERRESCFPIDDKRLQRAFGRWLEVDPDVTPGLDRASAAEHLGYQTPEAMEVVGRADATRLRLEAEARRSKDRYLFHGSTCSLSPAGYTVVRLGGKARYFWLVGRGAKAQEIRPSGRPDSHKFLGFLGLGSSGAAVWEGTLRGIEWLAPNIILDGLQILAGLPDIALAGGATGSLLLVASGARRWFAKEEPVLTVALLPVSGRPTPWLTCLAYVGSYTQRLQVLDRAYDTQLERLLGKMRPERQSESLSLELDDRKLRLVEVAQPVQLPDSQVELMLRALDGVLILAEKDDEEAGAGAAASAFEDRLRTLAKKVHSDLRIARVTIDRSEEFGGASAAAGEPAVPSPPGALEAVPVEAIRRTFLDTLRDDADWDDLFERLWRPVARVASPL